MDTPIIPCPRAKDLAHQILLLKGAYSWAVRQGQFGHGDLIIYNKDGNEIAVIHNKE